MVIGCGNLGARPQPPLAGSNDASIAAAAASSRLGVGIGVAGVQARLVHEPLDEPPAGRLDLGSLLAPRPLDAFEHLPERRHPVARLVGEVGPAVERPAVGRQEDRHRPAPATGHRLDRGHVDLVEVGPLLAIHLDRDEVVVQVAGGRFVLERLALHDVAPMARRIADAQEDRPVEQLRPGQRVRPPRRPVDRVVRVLEEVRAGLCREPVGHWAMVPAGFRSRRDRPTRGSAQVRRHHPGQPSLRQERRSNQRGPSPGRRDRNRRGRVVR